MDNASRIAFTAIMPDEKKGLLLSVYTHSHARIAALAL
jgi:hypothetical protein